MKLSFVKPRPELQPYVETIWVFESSTGLPAADSSVAAPTGGSKLTFPFNNSLVSVANGKATTSEPERLYFVGNRDNSTLLRSTPSKTGCIGVEFWPHGAFPILGIPMGDVSNILWRADVLFGGWAREVQEVLANLQGVRQRVTFLQDQLMPMLLKNHRENGLVRYCVETLKSTDGRISVRELEERTGYSRRYLSLLFKEHVGLSPKVLAGIFRFQRFYRKWAQGQSLDLLKNDLYEYYYDQSHFAKEFRKMTGHTPGEYIHEVSNEFGRRLCLR